MAQTFTNEKFVKRRRTIGTYTNLAGLAILVLGFIASLNAEQVITIPLGAQPLTVSNILLAYAALIVGFALSTYGSRFLVYISLEPEKKIGLALKGMDKQYRLYSYALPVPFVLLTPFALYVLHVKPQDGAIFAKGDRWWQPFSLIRAFRFIAFQSLGNPERELAVEQDKLKAWLKTELPQVDIPVRGYILFLHPRAQVHLEDTNAPILLLNSDPDALKAALRRERSPNLPASLYNQVADRLKDQAHAQAAEQ